MAPRNFLGCYFRAAARLAWLFTAGLARHPTRRLIRKLDDLLSARLHSVTYWKLPVSETYAERMDPGLVRYTSIYELAVVCALADLHKREKTFLEIGTNEGRSTKNIAAALSDWSIETVDLPLEQGRTVEKWQEIELLPANEVGKFCRGDPRIRVHLGHADEIFKDRRFGAVFVDGDHSIEGVRRDTELAMRIADGVIIWHDYRPEDPRMGVAPYLDSLIEKGVSWHRVPRTAVAYALWPPSRGAPTAIPTARGW